jgi:hypothetical protein
MLAIDIIESKPLFSNPYTGRTYVDLLSPCWNTKNINYELKGVAFVTEETQMRPDLVSLIFMDSPGKMGSLLKINNISNPLSIKAGEILFVPGNGMINGLFKDGSKVAVSEKEKARSFRKELQDKISRVSEGRLEYLNAKKISDSAGGPGGPGSPLPPNILQDGQQQIAVDSGKLIFGPDIGQCRTKGTKNISVTDLKSKLAQKNIFNR